MTRLQVRGVGVRSVKNDALDWSYSHLCHKTDIYMSHGPYENWSNKSAMVEERVWKPVFTSGFYAKYQVNISVPFTETFT